MVSPIAQSKMHGEAKLTLDLRLKVQNQSDALS